MEFLHYRQFFAVWEVIERVGEVRRMGEGMQVQGVTRETRGEWVRDYEVRA